jgi:outer membrane protein assembly factor BamB
MFIKSHKNKFDFQWRILHSGFLLYLFILVLSCQSMSKPSPDEWSYSISDHGTSSTPRFADLNGDRIEDVVLGAGTLEHQHATHGVIALDGKSGELLWHVPSVDQMVGSASFIDINGDHIHDVIIGGRSSQLLAIDGSDGNIIWKYVADFSHPKNKFACYNFYNSQVLEDRDHDGVRDLLVSNGGNVYAQPYSEKDRRAGTLMIISGATGQIIALDTMPDGKETYFSPILVNFPEFDPETVIFGSGGETVSGHLYAVSLAELMANDISKAKILLSEEGRGFIAPVAIADVDQDGMDDIIGTSHRATIFVIDGATLELTWKKEFQGLENSSMIIPGNFRSMEQKDIFAHLSMGSFPSNRGSIQILLDGSDGAVIYQDTMGCFGFGSPILVQYDNDALDEVMYSVNMYPNCGQLFTNNINRIIVSDLSNSFKQEIIYEVEGKNLSVTPGVVDLDHDQSPELIYVVLANFTNVYECFGMSVKKIKHKNLIISQKWNSYMGTHYNGILQE